MQIFNLNLTSSLLLTFVVHVVRPDYAMSARYITKAYGLLAVNLNMLLICSVMESTGCQSLDTVRLMNRQGRTRQALDSNSS
jgi:hypothetical protein